MVSISVAVASYQADLRSRVSGKDSSILTGGAAEKSMLSGLDFLFAPKAEPRFWAVPIGVAQEVGSGQFHLEEARGCVTRKGEDS